eukprot:9477104-Pyramimonas_sp.AAC.1
MGKALALHGIGYVRSNDPWARKARRGATPAEASLRLRRPGRWLLGPTQPRPTPSCAGPAEVRVHARRRPRCPTWGRLSAAEPAASRADAGSDPSGWALIARGQRGAARARARHWVTPGQRRAQP